MRGEKNRFLDHILIEGVSPDRNKPGCFMPGSPIKKIFDSEKLPVPIKKGYQHPPVVPEEDVEDNTVLHSAGAVSKLLQIACL
jgi:hypothetical protein